MVSANQVTAQDYHVKVSKSLDYKQPVTPVGTDNYLFSTYYYNGRKVYSLKGLVMGQAQYDIQKMKFNPAGSSYVLISQKKDKSSVEIRDTWDAGRPITSLKEITSPTAICYSTDSRYLYVASSMNICVYETRSNTLVAKWDLQITPSLMATNPKGLHLAASEGTTIAIVDLESGKTKALRRTRIFPWLTSTDPHDCISKGKTSHPYILQTL